MTSSEATFPFDPAKLAALGTLAAGINDGAAPAPFSNPIVVTEHGHAFQPYPFNPAQQAFTKVHDDMLVGWSPMPEVGAVLLSIWGSERGDERGHHNVTATLTQMRLRAFIGVLQAIDAALGGAA